MPRWLLRAICLAILGLIIFGIVRCTQGVIHLIQS
jgi:hypothetical protein